MKKLAESKSKKDHYVADAAYVACLDQRFNNDHESFKQKRGFKVIDPVTIAGGVMKIVHGKKEDDNDVLSDLAAVLNFHKVKHIVLQAHEGCAAYSDMQAKSGLSWSDFLDRELTHARAIVDAYCNSHPNAKICKEYWADQG